MILKGWFRFGELWIYEKFEVGFYWGVFIRGLGGG